MAKRVTSLVRYAKVCLAVNRPCLDARSVVRDPGKAYRELHAHACPVRVRGRSHRGFNPINPEDLSLFTSVLRGEHSLHGF